MDGGWNGRVTEGTGASGQPNRATGTGRTQPGTAATGRESSRNVAIGSARALPPNPAITTLTSTIAIRTRPSAMPAMVRRPGPRSHPADPPLWTTPAAVHNPVTSTDPVWSPIRSGVH
ncbi:hypothetical protein GCM10023321_09400 [Pseudonocardia eucalypti]|uniref:Uncharacterized protein n=1 Tax=Pseudonocardia eucalypti TaxID=648755 RepID=A0ABP9PJX7_9PSEU